jgi:hypothetical protein
MRSIIVAGIFSSAVAIAQPGHSLPGIRTQVVVRAAQEGKVTVVQTAPHFTTAIRMYEPVNSVVVGDPATFAAEHSEREPETVFIKPITLAPARTNVVITTTRGHQATIMVASRGTQEDGAAVDVLLRYRPPGGFLIEESTLPGSLISETASLADATVVGPGTIPTAGIAANGDVRRADSASNLDQLLEQQERAPLPELYGSKPGVPEPGRELVKAGVTDVIDGGREVIVLFSVVNSRDHSVELMPPQVQLGGKVRTGWLFKKSQWSTAEQLPITDYRLSRRRIGPGERSDGVVVFDRPPFKQSNETLFLQVAETGAVDRPALAPIGFGVSSTDWRKEARHGSAGTQRSPR